MNSAIKQTKQNHLPLRIDGAHAVIVENVISKWTFDRAIIRATDNKAPDLIRIAEILTLKQAWTIGGMFDMKHPTRRKWRSTDNRNANPLTDNPSWRTMEQPPYMRGIDFTHPELW